MPGAGLSGICGIVHFDGRPVDPADLKRMTDAIVHRGPDGVGQRIGGPVGLAHLKLQTTPEAAHENQPLSNEEETCWLTFDGRIDNRSELRAALLTKGQSVRDDTDAELVLKAYEAWGEECPKQLLGDFAFAVWDARQRRVFCARDHMGTRPFYYHRSGEFFAFGSEIRALLAIGRIPVRLNESRLVDYLVEELDRDDQESTFYQDVRRLPAGHTLVVAGDRLSIADYWPLDSVPELKFKNLDECGEAFRSIFVEAVRCRLRSSHRVGAALSGGIDSSSIVCTIREKLASELKEPLHTVSLVDTDETKCVETPYIREVLQGGRLVPHIVRSDEVHCVDREMADSDEPFEFDRYFTYWFTFLAAKSAGMRVFLDGVGGDEITPPYPYLSTLIRTLQWRAVVSELHCGKKIGESPWRSLLSQGLAPLFPATYRLARLLIRGRSSPMIPPESLIDPNFARRMGVRCRLDTRVRPIWSAARRASSLHALSFRSGTVAFAFEHYGRMAALNAIETRHPFTDRRIVEFFVALPLCQKTYAPLHKRVIRAGMAGVLPEKVRGRTAYGHPGRAFLQGLHGLSAEAQSIRNQRSLDSPQSCVSKDKLVTAIEDGAAKGAYSVWQVAALEAWLKNKKFHKNNGRGGKTNGQPKAA